MPTDQNEDAAFDTASLCCTFCRSAHELSTTRISPLSIFVREAGRLNPDRRPRPHETFVVERGIHCGLNGNDIAKCRRAETLDKHVLYHFPRVRPESAITLDEFAIGERQRDIHRDIGDADPREAVVDRLALSTACYVAELSLRLFLSSAERQALESGRQPRDIGVSRFRR